MAPVDSQPPPALFCAMLVCLSCIATAADPAADMGPKQIPTAQAGKYMIKYNPLVLSRAQTNDITSDLKDLKPLLKHSGCLTVAARDNFLWARRCFFSVKCESFKSADGKALDSPLMFLGFNVSFLQPHDEETLVNVSHVRIYNFDIDDKPFWELRPGSAGAKGSALAYKYSDGRHSLTRNGAQTVLIDFMLEQGSAAFAVVNVSFGFICEAAGNLAVPEEPVESQGSSLAIAIAVPVAFFCLVLAATYAISQNRTQEAGLLSLGVDQASNDVRVLYYDENGGNIWAQDTVYIVSQMDVPEDTRGDTKAQEETEMHDVNDMSHNLIAGSANVGSQEYTESQNYNYADAGRYAAGCEYEYGYE